MHQCWLFAVVVTVIILVNFGPVSMVKLKGKRDKVVRITIENVDAPNTKVNSLKDVKDAPVRHKQILLLKAKDHHDDDMGISKGKEKVKLKEEQKKHIEKNIIDRLSQLLKRVKDIKQRHFHARPQSKPELIPLASEILKLHKKKNLNNNSKKKSLKYLHLPNEDMDKGDNNIISDTNGIVSDSNNVQVSYNTTDAPIDSNLGFFENRHLERVSLMAKNLTSQNEVNSKTSNSRSDFIIRQNNHTEHTNHLITEQANYSQNNTIFKMQYQDFENSSNPYNAAFILDKTRNAGHVNTNLTKNTTSNALKGSDADDFDTVNSNDKPFILKTLPTPSVPQIKTIHHTNPSPIAMQRHFGDRNDWGNSSPVVNSEDKHYWDKEKKTKANINNVNHRMKDFSSVFFVSATKHNPITEDDAATTSLRINKTSVESPIINKTLEISPDTNNSTLRDTSSALEFLNNTTNTTNTNASLSNDTGLLLNNSRTSEGVAKSLHVSTISYAEESANSTSPEKQEGAGVVVVVERIPTVKDVLLNDNNTNVKIADVGDSAVLPLNEKAHQENRTGDFTKHLLKQLQSLSSKRHFHNNTSDNTLLDKPKQTGGSETAVKDGFCDSKDTGSYADPNDCSKYWLCAGGKKYETQCPAGLVYNTVVSSCDDPIVSKNQIALTCKHISS